MEKFKQFFLKIKDKLTAIYAGEHTILAAVITVTGIIALSVTGIIIIKVTTSDTDATASTTPAVVKEITSTEERATEARTTSEVTTEETTTEAETTTEEPTTEVPTEPPTTKTVPETIPIEEISTVAQKEAEKFDAQEEARKQMAAEESTEAPTEPPSNNPSVQPPEKPTEPPKVSETAKVVTGIDISHWQSDRGKIDWNKVKNDGIDYVIIKAAGRSIGSDGSLYEDTAYRENIEGALSAGIPVGVYFFSQAITEQEAREEASLILALIKDYKITFPVVFDWETSNGYRTYTSGLSREKMNSIASTFCDMVQAAGYTPMVYGNGWDLTNRYNFDSLCAKYKIWLARYPAPYGGTVRYKVGDSLPSGKNIPSTYQMWQYCSDGAVAGINGNVDVNVSFFSYSGTEVPTTAIRLEVSEDSLTTNCGTAIDLMNGVTGFNTAGLEDKDSISVTVTNSGGEVVSQDVAFNTPGAYTVTYRLRDFTGASKSATAALTVRGIPILTLTTDTVNLSYNDGSAFISSVTGDMLKDYVAAATDFEGNDISSDVTAVPDSELESMTASGIVKAGTYIIVFTADDGKGLTASVSLTIIIAEEETTTPPETTTDGESSVPVETTTLAETSTPAETTTLKINAPTETATTMSAATSTEAGTSKAVDNISSIPTKPIVYTFVQ